MYPSELKQYIDERNGQLDSEEINFVANINFHSQLNHIIFNPWNTSYDMWDNLGNHYHFEVKR